MGVKTVITMHLKNEIATIVKEVEVQITTYEDAMEQISTLIDKAFEPDEFDFSRMTSIQLAEQVKRLRKKLNLKD